MQSNKNPKPLQQQETNAARNKPQNTVAVGFRRELLQRAKYNTNDFQNLHKPHLPNIQRSYIQLKLQAKLDSSPQSKRIQKQHKLQVKEERYNNKPWVAMEN